MEPATHEQTAPSDPFFAKIEPILALMAERAAEVDTGGPSNDLLRDNVRRLADIGFYGAGIAPQYGGLAMPGEVRREVDERLASACGVTTFTEHQLHAGGGFVNGSSDEEVKRELLPRLTAGEILCGVAFAHLRRPGKPAVTAAPVEGGYLVNGKAPWISVWGLLDAFVLGATADQTDEMLYLYVDIEAAGESLKASEAMKLAVMESSDTVSLEIVDLFIPTRYVLQIRPPDQLHRSDYCGITGHVSLPLGCARGSIDYLRTVTNPAAQEAADRLAAEVDSTRAECLNWNGYRAEEPGYRENALHWRAAAINLALRAAATSIAACGGRAHLLSHPAQRRLREAGFYATMALTSDTQSALMETFTHAC